MQWNLPNPTLIRKRKNGRIRQVKYSKTLICVRRLCRIETSRIKDFLLTQVYTVYLHSLAAGTAGGAVRSGSTFAERDICVRAVEVID